MFGASLREYAYGGVELDTTHLLTFTRVWARARARARGRRARLNVQYWDIGRASRTALRGDTHSRCGLPGCTAQTGVDAGG